MDQSMSGLKDHKFLGRLRSKMKRTLAAGLITLVPVAATFVVLQWVLLWMDSFAAPIIRGVLDLHIPGLGILLTLALVYIVGFLASSVLGRRGIIWAETMLMRLPIVKIVYNPVKKLLGTFAVPHEARTWKTVLVEYPRRGAWMVAFMAGELPSQAAETEMISVFIPNTPNPAAGRVIIVPKSDVRVINLPIDDAIEFVVSGGTAISESFVIPPLPDDRTEFLEWDRQPRLGTNPVRIVSQPDKQ
jgi:uncharacterized membrane protein